MEPSKQGFVSRAERFAIGGALFFCARRRVISFAGQVGDCCFESIGYS